MLLSLNHKNKFLAIMVKYYSTVVLSFKKVVLKLRYLINSINKLALKK